MGALEEFEERPWRDDREVAGEAQQVGVARDEVIGVRFAEEGYQVVVFGVGGNSRNVFGIGDYPR